MQHLPVAAHKRAVGPHASDGCGAATGKEVRIHRKGQEIGVVVAVEALAMGGVEDVERIGPQFQAYAFSARYLEGLLQGDIQAAVRRSSTRIPAHIAVEELEVHDVAGKRIDRAQTAGVGGSQEGVLEGSALRRGGTHSSTSCGCVWPPQRVGAVKRSNAGGGNDSICQHVRSLLGL